MFSGGSQVIPDRVVFCIVVSHNSPLASYLFPKLAADMLRLGVRPHVRFSALSHSLDEGTDARYVVYQHLYRICIADSSLMSLKEVQTAT